MPPRIPTCSLRVAAAAVPAPSLTLTLPVRQLSTTPSFSYRQDPVPNSKLPIPSVSAPLRFIPPYPLGPRQTYHQSNTGLYGNASIRFGNKVSSRNEIKTRRAWRPNVHQKRLWSESLGMFVRTRVTTRVLRTIDKVGGLDAYLLGIKPARIAELGPWGWRLRWRVMQTPFIKKKLKAERIQLGLVAPPATAAAKKGSKSLKEVEEAKIEEATDALLMEETTKMLENEEEFVFGDAAEGASEKPFMKEEEPSGKKA